MKTKTKVLCRAVCLDAAFLLVLFALPGGCGGSALGQAPACGPVPEGLASLYRGEGNAKDSVSGRDGTAQGGVGYIAGRVGQAFLFSGGEGSVLLPAQNLGRNFSVEFWVNPSRFVLGNGYQHLISNDWRTRNFGALYQFDDKISYWVDSTLIFDSSKITLNAWTHVALTYDGEKARLYLNGALDRTSGSFVETFNNAVRLGDGVFRDSSSTYQGLLDEVSLYNHTLSPQEVQAVFNGGSAGKCSNLGTTTVVLTASPGPYITGQNVTLTADVAPAGSGQPLPAGSVTFRDGAATLATVNLTGTGRAVLNTTAIPNGVRLITALYGGDGVYRPLSSAPLQVVMANVLASVSAADYRGDTLAPDQIIAAFGVNMATDTQRSDTLPLPTNVVGTTVRVLDSVNVERLAPLFYVSPKQVNYIMPAGTAAGKATITITSRTGEISVQSVQIAPVSPGLFSADQSGEGLGAAESLRIRANGSQLYEPVARYDFDQKKFVPVPIDLGLAGDQVFLVLYGTGIRYRSALSNVSVTLGGSPAAVEYAGPHPSLVGLDQVNVRLPASLAGRGDLNVVLTVDNKVTKTVRINVK